MYTLSMHANREIRPTSVLHFADDFLRLEIERRRSDPGGEPGLNESQFLLRGTPRHGLLGLYRAPIEKWPDCIALIP